MIGQRLNNSKKLVTIMSFNINGLRSKLRFLFDYLLKKQAPDILCLQECKVTNVKFFEMKLKKIGYSIIFQSSIRNDNDTNIRGGNAIIYRSDYSIELITNRKCPAGMDVESFSRIIGVKLVDFSVNIYSIYLPAYSSKKTCTENTEKFQKSIQYLEDLTGNSTNNIICGDWNSDFRKDAESAIRRGRLEIINNFLEKYWTPDTNLGNNRYSYLSYLSSNGQQVRRLIDRIVHTLDSSCCIHYEILSVTQSDHYPVLCKFLVSETQSPSEISQKRKHSKIDAIDFTNLTSTHLHAYKSHLNRIIKKWDNRKKDQEYLNDLTNLMENLAVKHLPKKDSRKVYTDQTLHDPEILQAKEDLASWTNFSNLLDQHHPSWQFVMTMVQRSRKKLNQLMKKYQFRERRKKAKTINSSNLFDPIKKTGVILPSPPKEIEGHQFSDQLDFFHAHYTTTFKGQNIPRNLHNFDVDRPSTHLCFTLNDLNLAIEDINMRKAYRRHKIWKICSTQLSRMVLIECFNNFSKDLLINGHATWDFLESTISPILKSADKKPSLIKSYRPISLMSSEAWLLETMLKYKTLPYLRTKDSQFAYKSDHSCAHAITIAKRFNEVDDAHVLLLDASSAFDLCSHERIRDQLKKREVPADLAYFGLGLLMNTKFKIRWFDELSIPIFPHRGVKQGGILSALLFASCYDDLIESLVDESAGIYLQGVKLNHLVFADDILLVSASSFGLELLYDVVLSFANRYSDIKMNPTKSVIMRMGRNKLAPVSFRNIPKDEKARYLGAMLSEKQLKDQPEINRCRGYLYGTTNNLLNHNDFHLIDQSMKRSLMGAYSFPYAMETLPEVPSSIRRAHRFLTMKLWPASFKIKFISSRKLYNIAEIPSLPECHRLRRNLLIVKSQRSQNELIRNLIGTLETIRAVEQAIT